MSRRGNRNWSYGSKVKNEVRNRKTLGSKQILTSAGLRSRNCGSKLMGSDVLSVEAAVIFARGAMLDKTKSKA
jgi:hypothetical protein